MTNTTKNMKNGQNPITEKEIRRTLDLIDMNDECQGWRSMKQLTEAMSDIEPSEYWCRYKTNAWFRTHNREDRYFETSFIDGEWCYRSHKFNLCRDRFLRTIKDYKRNVIRYPEQKNKLTTALCLDLRAALQPPITARRQLKKVNA